MPKHKYRFQMYQHLGSRAREILAEADNMAKELKPPQKRAPQEQIGAPAGAIPPSASRDKIREIVKDALGDDYDACPFSSAESAMWAACQGSFAPRDKESDKGGGARYIMPWEKYAARLASYGSVHPAKYRNILAEKGCRGPSQFLRGFPGLGSVVVPLHGAIYANHGISFVQTPFLTGVDPESSLQIIAAAAEAHTANLAGFISLGYDTPGLSGGVKSQNGAPLLQLGLSQIAAEFNVPYVVDARHSFPFMGETESPLQAGATVYRLWPRRGDRSPALLVGAEELISPIRKDAGFHIPPPSFGYAAEGAPFESQVPEPETVAYQADLLALLRGRPRRFFELVDDLHELVLQGLEECPKEIRTRLRVSKSYGMMGVEINYEDTWLEGIGLPVFTDTDTRAGTNLLRLGLDLMGATGIRVEDASIYLDAWSAGCPKPGLDADNARHATKCLARLLAILGHYSGFLGP